MTATLTTSAGYRATRDAHGVLTVHAVPIFCTCSRAKSDGTEVHFDDKWIAEAVKFAKQGEREQYLPPLHIFHHGDEKPRRAGRFRVTHTGPITYEGKRRTAVFADLILVDAWAQEDVLKQQLPYRSVELKIAEPQFQSLALLDTEAPYLRLPMLMVGEVDESFSIDDLGKHQFTAGADARLVFAQEALAMTEQTQLFEDDEKDDGPPKEKKDGDDEMQDEGIDIKSVIKAITSGEIQAKDLDAIREALQAYEQGGQQEQPAMQPAAAAVPGGAAMSADKDLAVQFAALRGELDGIKAERAEDKAIAKRKDDVAHALERLRDRPCGADIETKLTKFHQECGGKEEVFNAYVDALANTVAPRKQTGSGAEAFVGTATAPDFVMKYHDQGGDAVDRANAAWLRWKEARATGATSLSEERYVELAMRRSERVFNAGRN